LEVIDTEQLRANAKRALQDANTPFYVSDRLGIVLGLIGNKSDAPIFQKHVESQINGNEPGIMPKLLVGYILLDKTAGLKCLHSLADPRKSFNHRYKALLIVRFFWDEGLSDISKDEQLKIIEKLLQQGDMADLPIYDLIRWKQWNFTPQILKLSKTQPFQAPIMKRTILQYMLSVPSDPEAQQYVSDIRARDPDKIRDAEVALEAMKQRIQK
jgi:hypothetical protein